MKENKEVKAIRCAIYTRKSTSEGLEQDFTSLDAQRESGENYIRSQQHQGWIFLSNKYDDGGFTGATTDRPALQRLLQDIKEKKIDCVVVYKVDRLSRSLLDFTKLLQFFDEQSIAFVSVTQHFNTNTSMGRLTLNILLSFAQFEREMISERTKDKMGAARMKGKWVGGKPGLGYDVDPLSKKLTINPQEAKIIESIFSLYLEKRSLLQVAQTMNVNGYRTKEYKTRKGTWGGVSFKNTNIQMILKNPTYIGKVQYEGKIYQGLHDPIINEDTFSRVQEALKQNQTQRGVSKNRRFQGLLSGLFRCSTCETSMCHSYTKKGHYKYRYYICLNAIKRNRSQCPTKSINASSIEETCLKLLRSLLNDNRLEDAHWGKLSLLEQSLLLNGLVQMIGYEGNKSQLKIQMKGSQKTYEFDLPLDQLKKNITNSNNSDFENEPPIRRQLLLAHQIQQMLDSKKARNVEQIAGWLNMSKSRISQIMSLLCFCPRIQEEIVLGESKQLMGITEYTIRAIPKQLDWQKQEDIWVKLTSLTSS